MADALDVDFVEQKSKSGLDLSDAALEQAWREVKTGGEGEAKAMARSTEGAEAGGSEAKESVVGWCLATYDPSSGR